MILTLIPQLGADGDEETAVHVADDVITINGQAFDLSDIEAGRAAVFPGTRIIGEVQRESGILAVSVLVTLAPNADANQPTDPAHWTIMDPHGRVIIPAVTTAIDSDGTGEAAPPILLPES
jgi:hypothetical protein